MKRLLLPLLAFACLAGCSSYQLGSPGSLAYRSIEVATSKNFSTLPQIETSLNAQLRQSLAQSHELKLASGGQSDAVLEVTVLDAKREIAAVTPDDVGRGRKFELTLEISLSLRDPNTSGNFFIEDRRFEVTQDIFTDGGQITAEYQATTVLAADIARRAIEILEDAW